MFLRFVVFQLHNKSGRRNGLFGVAYDLTRNVETPAYLVESLLVTLDWFSTELRIPFRAIDVSPTFRHPEWQIEADPASISWIKDSAVDHIGRMRDLAFLVSEAGWVVEEIRTARPGLIIYEDEHQVVARPFADTPT